MKIFTINPGSTSTKVALFENGVKVFAANVTHDVETLQGFGEIRKQFDYRKTTILRELGRSRIRLEGTDAFVGRGGGLVGLVGGTYPVNEILLDHARRGLSVKHPATLGSQLADHFARQYGGKAFVVNPPDVDEFEAMARVTGFSNVFRESRIHALNQKEVGIRYGEQHGKPYEECNLIIAHIGGGVSVAAHRRGRMVDANDTVNGDGPMAPTRAGALPAMAIVKLCFSGKFSEHDLCDRLTRSGGLVDHLGTSDVREVLDRIQEGDRYAKLVFEAMIYQIGKHIGACAAVLRGDVDAILLTGGISHSRYLTDRLEEMVSFIAPVQTMAGEFEMEALASGALRVLEGREEAKKYTGVPVWDGALVS
ncbi:MAG: butyrate kinase [Desulfopila sp.]